MSFRKYRLRKIWLDKCLKSRVSEDPSRDNTANVSKHSSDLNDCSFTIFINHCEGSWIDWKKPVLAIHKTPRLFANTLTVDEKNYLLSRK